MLPTLRASIGWVSPQANDTAIAVLNQAVTAYNALPSNDRPAFSDSIQQTVEGRLLAKLLSQLNSAQQQYDALADEVATRQQKLFFDWCYHIDAIENNVIQGAGDIGQDISGDYLLDGLTQIFPSLARCGVENLPGTSGPAVYTPSPFRRARRAVSGAFGLSVQAGRQRRGGADRRPAPGALLYAGGTPPCRPRRSEHATASARDSLQSCLAGGSTAASYLSQAVEAVQNALPLAAAVNADFAAGGALATLKSGRIDPEAALL